MRMEFKPKGEMEMESVLTKEYSKTYYNLQTEYPSGRFISASIACVDYDYDFDVYVEQILDINGDEVARDQETFIFIVNEFRKISMIFSFVTGKRNE